MEASPPTAEVACETTDLMVEASPATAEEAWDLIVETSPPMMEVALDALEDTRETTLDASPTTTEVALLTAEDTKLDARLRIDEAADSMGLPVGTLTPPVSVSPGTVRVPPGSPMETPTLPPFELEEGVGLIETMTEERDETALTEELLGFTIEGSTTELKVGNWPFLLEVEPCLTPPVAEEIGLEPREAELLAGLAELDDLTELLTGLTELLALEVLTGLTELALEVLTGLTELALELALELLTTGLLELFRVGIEMGSLKELLDLVETLALLVAGLAEEVGFLDDEELVFFEDEDELDFLLLEGTMGFLLLEGTTGFLLEEDETGFLLEATGLTVTVDFLVEEAGLVELVNFKMLETVSFLLEIGLTTVDAFLELLLETLALLVAFLVLLTLVLLFLELVDTLVLEDFLMEVGLGREKVVVGLIVETLAVAETPRVAETPTLRRGSRLSRRTFSATSAKASSLLS